MSAEAKVGAFTLVALALLSFIVIQTGNFSFSEGDSYKLQAVFKQVNGLRQGNVVRYAGVDIGKVSSVEPNQTGVVVTLTIDSAVKIPVDAAFSIGSDGLMGEKFITISPGNGDVRFLLEGERVQGYDQRGLDQLIVNADDVLLNIQSLVKSLNEIFGDKRAKNAMIESAVNAREITENLSRLSIVITRMAVDNEQAVRQMVDNLSIMSENLRNAAGTVERMVADVDNNGQTAADLRFAIENLSRTSQRIENMAIVLEDVITEPGTAENLKTTLKNAKEVSENANRMMKQVTSPNFSTEVLYGGGHYMTNAELRFGMSDKNFVLLGMNDIGESNTMNFQVGSKGATLDKRIGIFENKVGVGVDAQVSPQVKFSLDAYDPNEFRLQLKAQYEFSPNTFLVGQVKSMNRSEQRKSYIGLRKEF